MAERRRLVQLALGLLHIQRAQLDKEIAELEEELRHHKKANVPPQVMAKADRLISPLEEKVERQRRSPNKGKPMSAEQKRKISASMKKRWAERRSTELGPKRRNRVTV